MPDFIQQNSAAILMVLGLAYGAWKAWPLVGSLGKFLPFIGGGSPSRADAFAALETLRTHFKDNPRGLKGVQDAGAAFWEEPGA